MLIFFHLANICLREKSQNKIWNLKLIDLNASDGPALIEVNIYLRNIHKIDDVKMVREELEKVESEKFIFCFNLDRFNVPS